MGTSKKTKSGEMPESEMHGQEASLNEEMTDDELDKISAAGTNRMYGGDGSDMMIGTDGRDSMRGGDGNDYMQGGAGNDIMRGDDGSDVLIGGAGNDTLDGGNWDGANDIAHGGEGDDTYLWRVHGEGDDVFVGGPGNDTIKLWNLDSGTLESVWENGSFDITLEDSQGNNVEITSDMFDERGNLILPPDCSGVITGPTGETLTFDGVEKITKSAY